MYRSRIHGRGLFCKRAIEEGEMIVEYAGQLIRTFLTDMREKKYESKGIGCYMFRIDEDTVIDATMHGNAGNEPITACRMVEMCVEFDAFLLFIRVRTRVCQCISASMIGRLNSSIE